MNSRQHVKVSTIGGALIAGAIDIIEQLGHQKNNPEQKFDFKRLIKNIAIGSLCGLATSTLPDIMEPAINSHHRKFFHSLTFLALLLYGNYKLKSGNFPPEIKKIINALSVGYGLHLAADVTTPRSLPLI